MDINLTLIGQAIAMTVFVWFCMKVIWPPIMTAIEERQKEIADGLAAAERGQQSLDKAKSEADDIVGDARKQATTILDQAHARAGEIVAEGKSDGVKERERQIAAAQADVEPIALAQGPTVAKQIPTEIEFGYGRIAAPFFRQKLVRAGNRFFAALDCYIHTQTSISVERGNATRRSPLAKIISTPQGKACCCSLRSCQK